MSDFIGFFNLYENEVILSWLDDVVSTKDALSYLNRGKGLGVDLGF